MIKIMKRTIIPSYARLEVFPIARTITQYFIVMRFIGLCNQNHYVIFKLLIKYKICRQIHYPINKLIKMNIVFTYHNGKIYMQPS